MELYEIDCDFFWYCSFFIYLIPVLLGTILTQMIDILLRVIFQKTAIKEKWDFANFDLVNVVYGRVPWQPMVIGITERIIFAIITIIYPEQLATPIIGWMGIKLATGWNRISGSAVWRRMLAFNAIFHGIISISIAVLTGIWVIQRNHYHYYLANIRDYSLVILIGSSILFIIVLCIIRKISPKYIISLEKAQKTFRLKKTGA